MATLTGFTRPVQGDSAGNPIVTEDMRIWIVAQTSLTITLVIINPTTIDVTGTITGGDTSAIQTAINSYIYATLSGSLYIPVANMSNTYPMADDSTKVVTEHVALAADTAVLAVANSKTAVRFWDAGTFLNGNPNTGDMIIFTDNVTIASSGNGIFYLTSDHTSSGSALCSSIILDSVRGGTVDSAGNYNSGQPSVTSNKTVTVPFTKQSANGITLLSTTVLGSITFPAAPNATVITLFAIGISV